MRRRSITSLRHTRRAKIERSIVQTRRAPLRRLRRPRVHLLPYQMCTDSTPGCLKKSYPQKRYPNINLGIVRLNSRKGKNHPSGLYTNYPKESWKYFASTSRRTLRKDSSGNPNPRRDHPFYSYRRKTDRTDYASTFEHSTQSPSKTGIRYLTYPSYKI